MVALLYHIDEIARSRKADVVWIAFEYKAPGDWERMPKRMRQQRARIISWLEQRKVAYERCFGFFGGAIEEPYRGDLFVDLPIDRTNKNFAELEAMLEHPDTLPKFEGVRFYMLPLKEARKNRRSYQEMINGVSG
jgi:hypothetical protein